MVIRWRSAGSGAGVSTRRFWFRLLWFQSSRLRWPGERLVCGNLMDYSFVDSCRVVDGKFRYVRCLGALRGDVMPGCKFGIHRLQPRDD